MEFNERTMRMPQADTQRSGCLVVLPLTWTRRVLEHSVDLIFMSWCAGRRSGLGWNYQNSQGPRRAGVVDEVCARVRARGHVLPIGASIGACSGASSAPLFSLTISASMPAEGLAVTSFRHHLGCRLHLGRAGSPGLHVPGTGVRIRNRQKPGS